MAIEIFELAVLIVILVTLAILYIIYDIIHRTKGTFNRGWKVLFVAILMFLGLEILELLDALGYVSGALFGEVLEIIFILIILFSVVIINSKVREVRDGHKKLKYRAKKKK